MNEIEFQELPCDIFTFLPVNSDSLYLITYGIIEHFVQAEAAIRTDPPSSGTTFTFKNLSYRRFLYVTFLEYFKFFLRA
uniref:Cyclic nucleotide-binding domain-containing protein n=1 Tax=Strongyloides venezuelensis TaxID=75913 RepID=A0A0K0F0S6_STRVS